MIKTKAYIPRILLALGTLSPLAAQDFRVELFPSRRVAGVNVKAGNDAVRICSQSRPVTCLTVPPNQVVRCAPAGEKIRCAAAGSEFRSASIVSPLPFRLETVDSNSDSSPRRVELRSVELFPGPDGLLVISTVDLEVYVRGVLSGEAATLKNPAALSAMAVVARTWALRWRGRHRAAGFDFCSLTHCQVFRQPESSTADSLPFSTAAKTTRGQVVKFHGQLIDPYFSADCGGMVEAAGDVWPDRAAPYLVSAPDPYCAGAGHAPWQRKLTLQIAEEVLRAGVEEDFRGPLRDLSVETRDSSGRARTLLARGASTQRIEANQFRYALDRRLGWNTLKSNLYTLDRQGDSLVFTGRGLGHGVGLCQAGADERARAGISYSEILAAYLPGTNLWRLASEDADPILSSEHFELVFPGSQQPWAGETLAALKKLRRGLGELAAQLPPKVRAQTFATTEEFIRATGQPGWAAASSDGRSVALQPLSTLKRKGILETTLRHELMHLIVHPRRAANVPQWFEEGLVLYLTGEKLEARESLPRRSLEESLSEPRSEAEMKSAYAHAAERVCALARERGGAALWRVLERPAAEDLRWLSADP